MKDKQRAFIDSNILVYSIYGTPGQKEKIGQLLMDVSGLPFLSTQVLKEFANVRCKKKLHKTKEELKQHLTQAKQSFTVEEISVETIFEALDLRDQYHYSFYDCLIIASSLENKCTVLYSEDLQHGQIIRKKLKIINPF